MKAVRLLIWGGLALMLFSIVGCGVGCLGGFGAGLEGDLEAAEFGGGLAGVSILLFFAAIVMVAVGFVMKALGKDK